MSIPEKVNSEMKQGGTLAELRPGQRGVIDRMNVELALKRKLNALGLIKGAEIVLEHTAPMGDPRAYSLLGYHLSLRNEDARRIILRPENEPNHDAGRREDTVIDEIALPS